MTLRCIAFDTATLHPGQQRLSFFHDREGPSSDDTVLEEAALVSWLFTQPQVRQLVLGVLSLSVEALDEHRVVEPFLSGRNGKPGDIDVLACVAAAPHKAVAMECKRVKVRAGDESGQTITKLGKLGHSPAQVNALCNIGFYRTYLTPIVIVHDLSEMEYNFIFRGLREATFSRVVHVVEELRLCDHAGILYVEIAQPVHAHIQKAAVVCAGLLRPAKPREQSHDLTERVRRYFRYKQEGDH